MHVLCPLALHLPFTLAGDPSKSPPAWGIEPDGRRFEIVWPPGFRARFTPDLEIVDPNGSLIARAGTVGGIGGAGDDPFYPCNFGGKIY